MGNVDLIKDYFIIIQSTYILGIHFGRGAASYMSFVFENTPLNSKCIVLGNNKKQPTNNNSIKNNNNKQQHESKQGDGLK